MDGVQSLITPDTQIKVSSTLDKSSSKKYLTDGNPETCWSSQQGTPQFIQLTFPSPMMPRRISITFQGGFVGIKCSIQASPSTTSSNENEWTRLALIYPEDVNRPQAFEIAKKDSFDATQGVVKLKVVFEEGSDLFGRIVVYDLRVDGDVIGGEEVGV